MSHSSLFSGLFVATAVLATAQTAPSAPPAAAAPHAHGHAVVALDQFVTTATPFARNQVDLAQSTTVLGGRSLLLKQQPTLGETLAAEPGISATSFGPGASRPLIRGLGGDRIRLLENSVGTLDASVISPDHAVSVEPFLVERIEVVHGPASLLYGGNAVGGVVNVITHRIETEVPAETVRGGGELRYGSAADDVSVGGVIDVAHRTGKDSAVVLHLDGSHRRAENLAIPGFAESARIRAEETAEARSHGEPAPDFARDRLPNSSLENRSGAAGLSWVSPMFQIGAAYSGFESNYGVPGHAHEADAGAPAVSEGVRIDLRQRRTDLQSEWRGGTGWVRGARVKFGHADYRHTEFEPDGTAGTVFTNRGHEARAELLHGDGRPWTGALGLQTSRSRFAAIGDEAFLPPSTTRADAIFAFEELARGPVVWQAGARLERTRLATAANSRTDRNLSASLGAVLKPAAGWVLAASLSHTGRAPNAQELYADGAHAGTGSYEIGDAGLGRERSLGAEVSLRRRTGRVTGGLTVFLHRFDGYIFEQPTGLVAVEHDGAWEFETPAAGAAHGHEETLPVYRYVARDARFHGAEAEAVWHLHESGSRQLDLRLAADLTRAEEGGRALPRIPAARTTVGLLWAAPLWSAGLESQFILRQNRVAANETASGASTVLNAHLSRTVAFGAARGEIFLRGTNLTDAEIRPHPSFVKELAPLAGRGVAGGVRFSF